MQEEASLKAMHIQKEEASLTSFIRCFYSSDYADLSERHSCYTDYARILNGRRPIRPLWRIGKSAFVAEKLIAQLLRR